MSPPPEWEKLRDDHTKGLRCEYLFLLDVKSFEMTIQRDEESIILHILVYPKASEDRVVGFHGETLKVKVTAPPTGGKANQRLIKVLAKRLNIAQSHIEIIQGRTSRRKVLRIWNVGQDQLDRALKPRP